MSRDGQRRLRSIARATALWPIAALVALGVHAGGAPRAAVAPQDEDPSQPPWIELFDGATLGGWRNPFAWGDARVADGAIELRGERKFFLVCDAAAADFVLEAQVQVPEGGNSGIQFRSRVERERVVGYQAEVDPSPRRWSGGLYDEGRRGWLAAPESEAAQAAFRPGGWNDYRITCCGDAIAIEVNGTPVTSTRDPVALDGAIALQHHGEAGVVCRFRGLRLRPLGRHEWRPLLEPGSLAGWHARPGGEWRWLEEERDGGTTGAAARFLRGTSSAGEARHALLVSDAQWDDATVRVRFRATRGNSGLYFRCDEVDDAVGAHGLQAEIDARRDCGGLYETGGRGWIVRPDAVELARRLDAAGWNELVVAAHGRDVDVFLGGWRSSRLRDDPGRLRGRLALQLHGGMEMEVDFAAVELLVPGD